MTIDKPEALIVEDDMLVRIVAATLVEDAGFTAHCAADADEAMALLSRAHNISLLFTDVNMPGSMNGVALAHCVRERWPDMGVIVTSGKMVPGETALPYGSSFISKPYLPAKLEALLMRYR